MLKIRLERAFGQVIEAEVMTLPIALDGSETTKDENQVQGSALITVAVTPLLDAGLECLFTPGDYELLCRKQDKDRVRKLEVSDKEHSENSDCEIICPDKVRVSTNKVDSIPEKISATINEGDSGNSNSDAMWSDDASVSTGEINSKE